MPCALAAILLTESCALGCHMQKTLFPGTYWVHARTGVFGPFLHTGCASEAWVHGGSLGNDMGAGWGCLAPPPPPTHPPHPPTPPTTPPRYAKYTFLRIHPLIHPCV
jgi:hypothetical protein